MLVVGLKRVDYVRKSDNQRVQGYNIYCNLEQEGVDGFACKDIYVSDKVIKKGGGYVPKIGHEICVYYNEYRSPSCIFQVEG